MQLTDWLVVLFIVAIVAVLVDGVRRKLAERRNRVVMKLDRNLPVDDVDIESLPNSELPNGGARTLVRDGQPAPSLRTLQSKRKLSSFSRAVRAPMEDPGVRAVPVLLDAVDVEEERIEHTNVFADPHAVESFPDGFLGLDAEHPGAEGSSLDLRAGHTGAEGSAGRQPESFSASAYAAGPASAESVPEDDANEIIDGLDEEYEEDAMLAESTVARKEPGYMDTRYQGRDEEDDVDDDDEEEFEDEDEDEDDLDDDLESPDEFEDDDDEDEDEDEDDLDDDDEDDDDFDDDEEEDDLDDDDEEDEEDEEEDDEDLDELEGLPEDDWGNEEEDALLVDDYENEPMPLQGAFDKAASTLDKAASQFNDRAASTFDKAASTFDKAASAFNDKAASAFSRPPRQDAARIEPGFDGDAGGLGSESFDDTHFSEDFSGAWVDESDALDAAEAITPRPMAGRPAPQPPASKATPLKRDQGELFREPAAAREPREENRLMAALQKAVPVRSQPVAEQAPVAPVPQEVIIINVMARPGQSLYGRELLSVLQGQGLRLGDMSIFHRHADSQGSGPVMFSMANMVKPGTFDLATMDAFTTPGVSFFLQMPNKLGNMACFEKMLGAASAVRDAFDAELKDEHRSVFTRQTVEHSRQRVRDFELKLLSRK